MNPQALRNLKIVRGETLLMRISALNGVAPMDLTSYTFAGQIRGTQNELVGAFGFDTSTPLAGYITVLIDKLASAAMPVGLYRYDIFATAPDGVATVIAKGNIDVIARVTA
jgi:hypothetical protein